MLKIEFKEYKLNMNDYRPGTVCYLDGKSDKLIGPVVIVSRENDSVYGLAFNTEKQLLYVNKYKLGNFIIVGTIEISGSIMETFTRAIRLGIPASQA